MLQLCPLSLYQQELRVRYKRRHDRELVSANALLAFTARDSYFLFFSWSVKESLDGASHHITGSAWLLSGACDTLGEMVSESLTFAGPQSYSLETLVNKKKHVSFHECVFVQFKNKVFLAEAVPVPPAHPWGAALSQACWAQSSALVVSGGRNAALCPHPPALAHLLEELSLSVVQHVCSLLLGVSVRRKKIQPAKQRSRKHLLPSALTVALR